MPRSNHHGKHPVRETHRAGRVGETGLMENYILWGIISGVLVYVAGTIIWDWHFLRSVRVKLAVRNLDAKYRMLLSSEGQKKK
jgi:hypothetical protein